MNEIDITVISQGIAYGNIVNIENDVFVSNKKTNDKEYEKSILRDSFKDVISDLKNLQKESNEEFLMVHIMILQDKTLTKEVDAEIDNNSFEASKAFDVVINKYIKKFQESKSFYLEERNLDFKDIRRRVLKKLNNDFMKHLSKNKVILVCDELYPSYLSEYRDNVAGVIARSGGTTSHGAILCKDREIPYVIYDKLCFDEDSSVVIDTRSKKVFIDCSDEFVLKYKKLKKAMSQKIRIRDFSDQGITLFANVSNNQDLIKVRKYKLHGVGLYRTEFIFMNKDRPLNEEEQYLIYNDAVMELKQRPITFRTFDIGDDKQLSYIKTKKKGIRNYKNNKELFKNQVVALLKANRYSNMRIMFPMIETYKDFSYLRNLTVKFKKEINNNNGIKIGMMLETKKAFENLSDFKDIDFFSIGTNDLTKELYGIDRNKISDYHTYIDDLIDKLKIVVDHCKKYNINLSICGALAGIPEVSNRLIEIGITNFSVSPNVSKSLEQALIKYYNL